MDKKPDKEESNSPLGRSLWGNAFDDLPNSIKTLKPKEKKPTLDEILGLE